MPSIEVGDIIGNIFVNHEFNFKVKYQTESTIKTKLSFRLISVISCEEVDLTSQLTIKGNQMMNGPTILSIGATIGVTSMSSGDAKFYIEIYDPKNSQLVPVRSAPIIVVSAVLQVGKFENIVSNRWYKDRGGKKNFLRVNVSLVDHLGRLITNRTVRLKLTLAYASRPDSPINQDLLTPENGGKFVINHTGSTVISFRVEEVSRSHQHNKFILKIEPDITISPRNNDISPTMTEPIEVLSKPKPVKDNNLTKKRKITQIKKASSETESDSDEDDDNDDNNDEENSTENDYESPNRRKLRSSPSQSHPSINIQAISPRSKQPHNQTMKFLYQEIRESLEISRQINSLQNLLTEKLKNCQKIQESQFRNTQIKSQTNIFAQPEQSAPYLSRVPSIHNFPADILISTDPTIHTQYPFRDLPFSILDESLEIPPVLRSYDTIDERYLNN